MRNLYPKNKGKVYPSPSSSTTPNFSSSTSTRDVLSVLNLLPAAILALASVLSLEDREVLAYMISRSLTTPLSMIEENNKCKKSSNSHKPPIFECGCFDCYRSYWFRWDSSPNRELIQQVIEAFEDYLNNGGTSKKNNGRGGKKRDRMNRRRVVDKLDSGKPEKDRFSVSEVVPKEDEVDPSPESDAFAVISPARAQEDEKDEEEQVQGVQEEENGCVDGEVKWASKKNTAEEMEEELIQVPGSGGDHHHHHQQHHHRGLARKLIPDVLGLFNSRLWSLWSPSI